MHDFLVWYNNRDVVPFLDAIDKQFAFYKQQNIDMFKDGCKRPGTDIALSLQRTSVEHLLHCLQPDEQRSAPTRQRTISLVVRPSYFIATMKRTSPRYGAKKRVDRLWGTMPMLCTCGALMQDMPTGWYTRRREERQFRPQQAQSFGQMAVQWLTWEAAKNGCAIRHQVNGREKRIGKLPVDGWCPETRTAYQFHGCFFHGCPKCYDQNETNSMNGKTMATLLEKTRCKHRIPSSDTLK